MNGFSGPIKDITHGIFDGPHATPPDAIEGPIFLGIKNLTEKGALDFSEIKNISEKDYPKWIRRVNPQEDDIVFTYEATLHRYALIPSEFRGCLGRRLALIRPNRDMVDPKFLLYYLISPIWKSTVEPIVISGSTVDRIPISKFPDLKIKIPSIEKQKQIVKIISPYNDLIENNRRRIKLLEEAVRLLYQEWFVRFRFPGNEHTKIVDGVPDGWKKHPLSELCELINYGYTESAVNDEIGPKFLRITDIVPSLINWDSVPYCKIDDYKKEKYLLKEGDIVIARTGATVGYAKRINKRHPESVYASYLVRIRLNSDIDSKIVGILLESEIYKNYVKSNIGGAAQPNANAKVLTRFELLVAPKKIQQEFCDIISPILDQKEILQSFSQQLVKARDLLLPRLMNGVIPV